MGVKEWTYKVHTPWYSYMFRLGSTKNSFEKYYWHKRFYLMSYSTQIQKTYLNIYLKENTKFELSCPFLPRIFYFQGFALPMQCIYLWNMCSIMFILLVLVYIWNISEGFMNFFSIFQATLQKTRLKRLSVWDHKAKKFLHKSHEVFEGSYAKGWEKLAEFAF